MAKFDYTATDWQGKKVRGTIEADSLEAVNRRLRENGFTCVEASRQSLKGFDLRPRSPGATVKTELSSRQALYLIAWGAGIVMTVLGGITFTLLLPLYLQTSQYSGDKGATTEASVVCIDKKPGCSGVVKFVFVADGKEYQGHSVIDRRAQLNEKVGDTVYVRYCIEDPGIYSLERNGKALDVDKCNKLMVVTALLLLVGITIFVFSFGLGKGNRLEQLGGGKEP